MSERNITHTHSHANTSKRILLLPLLLLLLLHRRTHTGESANDRVNELAQDPRARGLVGKGLGDQAQTVEHVARMRVPLRAVAQHEELGVQEGREQTRPAGEHQDQTQRGNANLRERDHSQQVCRLELHDRDGEAGGPA